MMRIIYSVSSGTAESLSSRESVQEYAVDGRLDPVAERSRISTGHPSSTEVKDGVETASAEMTPLSQSAPHVTDAGPKLSPISESTEVAAAAGKIRGLSFLCIELSVWSFVWIYSILFAQGW